MIDPKTGHDWSEQPKPGFKNYVPRCHRCSISSADKEKAAERCLGAPLIKLRPVSNGGSFEVLHSEYLKWVRETFAGESVVDQLAHLREEFEELTGSPRSAEEYADVLMLLFCVADGSGIDILEAFRAKFEINRSRRWEKTARGYRHVVEAASSAGG